MTGAVPMTADLRLAEALFDLWDRGDCTSPEVAHLIARHRLAERERCALIADDGCDNAGDESEQRMARQIAAAIRENDHVG